MCNMDLKAVILTILMGIQIAQGMFYRICLIFVCSYHISYCLSYGLRKHTKPFEQLSLAFTFSFL